MKLSLLNSLFKKKSTLLQTPNSILIKKLKELSLKNNFLIFVNTNIYHTKLILINSTGIYVFETKEWTFKELRNAAAQKAYQQEYSSKTLSFDNVQEILKRKLQSIREIKVGIFNYLIMEYLSTDEYSHLNASLQDLLPNQKIIFCDSNENEILKKLSGATNTPVSYNDVNIVASSIFVQYSFLKEDLTTTLCTPEQILFLDQKLLNITHLQGLPRSGKSTLLLLKSIFLIIEKEARNILIIKPTILSADILKKRLLSILEHSILSIDLTSINIISKSQLKGMNPKKINTFEIVMCDDAHLFEKEFIFSLKEKCNKSKLLLVNDENIKDDTPLQTFKNQKKRVTFIKSTPLKKSISLIQKLLNQNEEKILIISNEKNREKLLAEMRTMQREVSVLQSHISLMNQNFTNVLLSHAQDINSLSPHHIIIMDLYSASVNEIEYALNLALKSVTVIYEKNSQEIKDLRNKYENN